MAHSKRRRPESKKARNRLTQQERPVKEKKKADKLKRHWAQNKEYQKRQEERQKLLEKKPGYARNLARGVREKEEAKTFKTKKSKMIEMEKRRKYGKRTS